MKKANISYDASRNTQKLTDYQETSKEAYESIQGQLGERQQQVLEAFRELGPSTNKTISQHLGIPINSITPRTKELRTKGLIEEKGTITQDGRKAITWGIK